ncbi:MAG: hypothetical protein NTY30_02330 [Candidatus Berkelbacteria bacterium]|nr:hypothetical protein [Candidatus Berkelbacteria bacterium]
MEVQVLFRPPTSDDNFFAVTGWCSYNDDRGEAMRFAIARLMVNILWPILAFGWAKEIREGRIESSGAPAQLLTNWGYTGIVTFVALVLSLIFRVMYLRETLLIAYGLERVALQCFVQPYQVRGKL